MGKSISLHSKNERVEVNEMRNFYGISAVVLCFAVLLAGCGGGGGGTAAPTGTTISGTVSAPSGVALGRSAGRSAAATGLVVKASVSVEAYLIDDSGNKSGSTLATATSNPSGVYSLTLPVGISAASNLVVVVGTGNNQMRSIVSSTSVNINPITEMVTSKIVADAQPLSSFSTGEINEIVSNVETNAATVDLSGASDISSAVSTLYSGTVKTYIDSAISDTGTTKDTSAYTIEVKLYKQFFGTSDTPDNYYLQVWAVGQNISAVTVTTPASQTTALEYDSDVPSSGLLFEGTKYYGKLYGKDITATTSEVSTKFPDGVYTVTFTLTDSSAFTKTAVLSGNYPSSLSLTYPSNGSTITTLTPTLTWAAPEAVLFDVCIETYSSPANDVYCTTDEIATTSLAVPSGYLTTGSHYYYRIEAEGALSNKTRKSLKRWVDFYTQ